MQVPVWSKSDQSDIKWYTATRRSNGTYRVLVDPKNHNNNTGTYQIHVYITGGNGCKCFVGYKTRVVNMSESYYTIMGTSTTTVAQMVSYYNASGNTYPSAELTKGGAGNIITFCQMYYDEAKAEGVRAEVAFCQAMKETGWLRYGGQVSIGQYNFAGLGATDGGAAGASFANVRTGIRAQIQHLKAYGSTEALKRTCVDTRFELVTRNSAPYVEWLGIQENPQGLGWATAAGYGDSILSMIRVLKSK